MNSQPINKILFFLCLIALLVKSSLAQTDTSKELIHWNNLNLTSAKAKILSNIYLPKHETRIGIYSNLGFLPANFNKSIKLNASAIQSHLISFPEIQKSAFEKVGAPFIIPSGQIEFRNSNGYTELGVQISHQFNMKSEVLIVAGYFNSQFKGNFDIATSGTSGTKILKNEGKLIMQLDGISAKAGYCYSKNLLNSSYFAEADLGFTLTKTKVLSSEIRSIEIGYKLRQSDLFYTQMLGIGVRIPFYDKFKISTGIYQIGAFNKNHGFALAMCLKTAITYKLF